MQMYMHIHRDTHIHTHTHTHTHTLSINNMINIIKHSLDSSVADTAVNKDSVKK